MAAPEFLYQELLQHGFSYPDQRGLVAFVCDSVFESICWRMDERAEEEEEQQGHAALSPV